MFVSGMLKKCVNLLSHDFSKSNLKKEVENEVPNASLDTTQILNKESGNEDLQQCEISNAQNGNSVKEDDILRIEATTVSDNGINADEIIDTVNQLLNETEINIAAVQEETIISNVQNKDLCEVLREEIPSNSIDTVFSMAREEMLDNGVALVNHNLEVLQGDDVIVKEDEINAPLLEIEPQQDICNVTANDPIGEKTSSGPSESCQNVDSNVLKSDLSTDIDIYVEPEPIPIECAECCKVLDADEYIDVVIKEEKDWDQENCASDTSYNLGANGNDKDHDSIFHENPIGINQYTFTDCVLSVTVDHTHDCSASETVNGREKSDTEITKEDLSNLNEKINSKSMAELTDKVINYEEEIAELRLQLNASQQSRASLELQLTQKEEIIIKSQTESLRKQQSYKQEIKQLKDKLEEKNSEEDNTPLKELQETNKSLKLREAKILSELNARKNDEQNYRKIMDEFEKTIGTQVAELQKLNEEHSVVKRHLATLEVAFSDVLQKYDRSKKIVEGFKCNEEALRQSLAAAEDNISKSEQKYESLKSHAKTQIEKCNQEILLMRDQYDTEIHKLTAIVKRLEIKNASLTDSLDQKIKECSALAALCDEVTGKV